MQLVASRLLEERLELLLQKRATLKKMPGLALVWIGNDEQTAKFIRTKQKMAQVLDCQFFLHHFEIIAQRQFRALMESLNRKKEVSGLVLQLPLPAELDTDSSLGLLNRDKDIDGLTPGSAFGAPTALGILALLKENKIEPSKNRTVIIGDGRLVGHPLSEIFRKNNWPFTQINDKAQNQASKIAEHTIIISCTGVPNIIAPAMVTKETTVIDGTGVDVDVASLEPLVKAITPKKGAIGPLTVSFLFENLLTAASR